MTTFTCVACGYHYRVVVDEKVCCFICGAHDAQAPDPVPAEVRALAATPADVAVRLGPAVVLNDESAWVNGKLVTPPLRFNTQAVRDTIAEREGKRPDEDDGLAPIAVLNPIKPDDTPGGAALHPPMAAALVDAQSTALFGQRPLRHRVFAGTAAELCSIYQGLKVA